MGLEDVLLERIKRASEGMKLFRKRSYLWAVPIKADSGGLLTTTASPARIKGGRGRRKAIANHRGGRYCWSQVGLNHTTFYGRRSAQRVSVLQVLLGPLTPLNSTHATLTTPTPAHCHGFTATTTAERSGRGYCGERPVSLVG